jgi:hypothetical protein
VQLCTHTSYAAELTTDGELGLDCESQMKGLGKQDLPSPFVCVPSMFDSLEVRVLYST